MTIFFKNWNSASFLLTRRHVIAVTQIFWPPRKRSRRRDVFWIITWSAYIHETSTIFRHLHFGQTPGRSYMLKRDSVEKARKRVCIPDSLSHEHWNLHWCLFVWLLACFFVRFFVCLFLCLFVCLTISMSRLQEDLKVRRDVFIFQAREKNASNALSNHFMTQT